MPKLKTHQASAKRFRITRRGTIVRRQAGQDHFNARESSRTTMSKRRNVNAARSDKRAINKLIPYH